MLTRWRRARAWDRKWAGVQFRDGWWAGEATEDVRLAVQDGWIEPGMDVLEVGCGSGENAAWLATQGCVVLAVDVSNAAIERARRSHPTGKDLTFSVADVTARRALGRRDFDAVVDRGCLHGLAEQHRGAYARNAARWVRPRGALVLITRLGPDHSEHARRQSVVELLGDDFELIDDRRVRMTLAAHRGEALDGLVFRLERRSR